jgi:hypothetical protein
LWLPSIDNQQILRIIAKAAFADIFVPQIPWVSVTTGLSGIFAVFSQQNFSIAMVDQ